MKEYFKQMMIHMSDPVWIWKKKNKKTTDLNEKFSISSYRSGESLSFYSKLLTSVIDLFIACVHAYMITEDSTHAIALRVRNISNRGSCWLGKI
jgi:hypothetical protein